MNTKPEEPIRRENLQIAASDLSSDEILKANSMNYWLEKISPEDIAKLWTEMQASVRAAKPHIMSEVWASGTTSSRGFRAGVTAPTTGDGFVLTFTVKDTCK